MDIKKDIKDFIADRSLIDDIEFEVSNVVIYTKNKNFFLDNSEIIKNLVSKEKKRIEVRLEPSLLMDEKEAENKIKEMGFEEAAITKLWFDAPRSIVTIEAEHPEIISGDRKAGINRIKEETGWSVVLARSPLIKSDIVGAIRENALRQFKIQKKNA